MSYDPLSSRVATDRSTARVRGVVVCRFVVLFVAVLIASAALTWAAAMFPQQAVRAQTPVCADPILCGDPPGSDPDVATSLNVLHLTDAQQGASKVKPNTGETWQVTARYATASGSPCQEETATAVLRLDQVAMGFNVACQLGCGPGSVFSNIGQCVTDFCGPSAYRLFMDVAASLNGANLYQVLYTTTSVDSGLILTSNCVTGQRVDPVTQVFQTADNGAFECQAASCGTFGATITIQYH